MTGVEEVEEAEVVVEEERKGVTLTGFEVLVSSQGSELEEEGEEAVVLPATTVLVQVVVVSSSQGSVLEDEIAEGVIVSSS